MSGSDRFYLVIPANAGTQQKEKLGSMIKASTVWGTVRFDHSAGMTNKGPMLRVVLFSSLILAAAPTQGQGLTVKTGESWMFAISRGQPVRARKVEPSVKPPPGQVLVTLRSMMGTSLSITSNNPRAYTYSAELIGAEKSVPVRSCTLPANGRLSFEHWPQKATAVRISNFKIAAKDGSCP